MSNLSPKQAIFVREYLKTHNATQSAIEAGYSPRTAYVAGSRLLKHAEVKRQIEQVSVKALTKHDVSLDRVIKEYERIAFVDPAELVDENGDPRNVKDMGEDARRAVSAITTSYTKDGERIRTIKTNSKVAALDALGKHLGMFPSEKQQINVGLGLEVHLHLDEVK